MDKSETQSKLWKLYADTLDIDNLTLRMRDMTIAMRNIVSEVGKTLDEMQNGFDIKVIEHAFFNYDSDGSEQPEEEYQKKRADWQRFKDALMSCTELESEEIAG